MIFKNAPPAPSPAPRPAAIGPREVGRGRARWKSPAGATLIKGPHYRASIFGAARLAPVLFGCLPAISRGNFAPLFAQRLPIGGFAAAAFLLGARNRFSRARRRKQPRPRPPRHGGSLAAAEFEEHLGRDPRDAGLLAQLSFGALAVTARDRDLAFFDGAPFRECASF